MANLHLDLNHSIELQIAQFKSDPEQMAEVNKFLNDIFEVAQIEIEKRNQAEIPAKKMTEQKKLDYGQIVLKRLSPLLRPDFLPAYAIVPLQCGVLLVLAMLIFKKYNWTRSPNK